MEQTMFDTLLSLPLFQGLGHSDLTRILESTRMEFTTAKAGTTFLRQGEVCQGLTFIIEGHVQTETMSADCQWSVTEAMSLPDVVGAHVLYGSQRTYDHSYTALRATRLLQMDKRTAAALTSYFEVFRLNMLNLLTTSIVRREQLLWLPPAATLDDRLIAFFRAHVCRPAGRKFFKIPLTILGAYLGEDPRYISKALHRLEDSGYLKLNRRLIEIPAFELLLQRNEVR
ncbi:MAG: Crp/Fnr family transcriptional regulator [Bacteroidales bacterium]|nr:Crp/Fnr family transcriptional regulator [Bacteroidales bacterium]